MARIGGLSLLVYVGRVAKAEIGLLHVGRQEKDKATQYYQETPWGPLEGLNVKQGPVIPSHHGENVSSRKLNNPVPTLKKHPVLDDGIDLENESKTPVGNRKCIFWQTSIMIKDPN